METKDQKNKAGTRRANAKKGAAIKERLTQEGKGGNSTPVNDELRTTKEKPR